MDRPTGLDEKTIRDELRKQGITSFDQLVSQAAQVAKEREEGTDERWYAVYGDLYTLIVVY